MKKLNRYKYWKIVTVLSIVSGIIADLVYMKIISGIPINCNACPINVRHCSPCPSSLGEFFRFGGIWELVGILLAFAGTGLIIGVIYHKLKK